MQLPALPLTVSACHLPFAELRTIHISHVQSEAVETPIFRGGWGSSLVMPWPSCKSKTQKKGHYLLAIVALYQLDYISLFIHT